MKTREILKLLSHGKKLGHKAWGESAYVYWNNVEGCITDEENKKFTIFWIVLNNDRHGFFVYQSKSTLEKRVARLEKELL